MSLQVLDIPALIIMIFTHVNPDELLVNVQRVSKKWHNIVISLIVLQQVSVFSPKPCVSGEVTPTHVNSPLEKRIAVWFIILIASTLDWRF